MSLTFDVAVNQTICGCDGGMTIFAYNGYPPYQYSIDGGVIYKNSPVFTNLCGGNYYVKVLDFSGQTFAKYVPMLNSTGTTTYTVNLNTFTNTLSDSNTSKTIEYTTTLTVTPSLPDNTYINFDIVRTSTLNTSPTFSSATKNSSSILYYNLSAVTYSYSGVVSGETFNTIPGCQNNTLFTNSFTEGWSNLTYYKNDTLDLVTVSIINKQDDTLCYIGDSNETFSVSNLRIFQCNCCNVIQG
jgi:hypothetical protein